MASIKEFTNKQGRKRWRVHVLVDGTMRHPEYRTFEEACHRVYLEEMHSLHGLTPKKFQAMKDFTIKKMIWLYLGGQWAKVLEKKLAQSTYRKAERELLAIPEEFADQRVVNVSKVLTAQYAKGSTLIWLRAAFRILVDEGVMTFNPCPKPVRQKAKKADPPPKEEVQRVFDAAQTPPLRMFVYLCAVCGLRTGEALAVRREDIWGDRLLVRGHVTAEGLMAGTKRNPGRTLMLPDEFGSLLAALDERCCHLVYAPSKPDRPVNEKSFRTHRTEPLYRAAGVKFSNHALRHFASANWIAEGCGVKELQMLLGHDDVMTTWRIYGHLFDAPRQVKNTLKI